MRYVNNHTDCAFAKTFGLLREQVWGFTKKHLTSRLWEQLLLEMYYSNLCVTSNRKLKKLTRINLGSQKIIPLIGNEVIVLVSHGDNVDWDNHATKFSWSGKMMICILPFICHLSQNNYWQSCCLWEVEIAQNYSYICSHDHLGVCNQTS